MNYGEAASAILIDIDEGHLFKKFYRGLGADVLTWLPYDEDEDNGLVFPVNFRFETGCSDDVAAAIFNSIIKPCILAAEFHHSRGKMAIGGSFPENLPTYEFYNPSFVARQLGFGQLPPRLFFANTLKPREGVSSPMEALRIFQLGSDLLEFHLHEWVIATFSHSLFNS